mmetsp:Transcript_50333/g.105071  ORF Transcript_50333/g.105071 Transcript_50333/m.105071 type:complete len:80 (+) Transcript_50333:49-288(+)
MFSLLVKLAKRPLKASKLDDEDGENTACDEFAIGHFCEDIKAPFVEEGHDSASMTYDGGFNSGFSAGMAWGGKMLALNP